MEPKHSDTLSYKRYAEKEKELLVKMRAGDKTLQKQFIANLNAFTNKVEEWKWKRFCLKCDCVVENCKCQNS